MSHTYLYLNHYWGALDLSHPLKSSGSLTPEISSY